MERELITVVIPVYKVERYLEKCVESVRNQTYKNLEIILVDDGSPDGCPALCDALAARDERIKVIHKENGGLSSARNAGLDVAAGEYVGFVDSDDYIRADMFEKLRAALAETGAGLAVCGLRCLDEAGAVTQELPPLSREALTPEQAYRRMVLGPVPWRYVTAWNRLYRRELFEGLRFREGKLHEDEFLAPYVYERCGRAVTVPDELYFYIQRGDGIMGSPVTVRRLDAVEADLERYAFLNERGLRELTPAVLRRAYQYLWEVINSVDVWRHQEQIRPYVKKIMAAQLRRLDIHGLWLWLGYTRRLRTCRGAGK